MKVISTIPEIKNYRRSLDGSVGFVPTMGALHDGHLSLVENSQHHTDHTIVSIYLNPTQFNNPEDLNKYPSNLEQDLTALKNLKVDAVFTPLFSEIYHDNYTYQVIEKAQSRSLCGAHREGHFDGVLTVIIKLFNILQPNKAFFGEKDFQQLSLIRGMVQAFFMDVEVLGVPTYRSAEGVALSSRNARLSEEGYKKAVRFAQALKEIRNIEELKQTLNQLDIEIDYIEERNERRFAAVHIENVRLIDNVQI